MRSTRWPADSKALNRSFAKGRDLSRPTNEVVRADQQPFVRPEVLASLHLVARIVISLAPRINPRMPITRRGNLGGSRVGSATNRGVEVEAALVILHAGAAELVTRFRLTIMLPVL
jgi:hypothetical protein